MRVRPAALIVRDGAILTMRYQFSGESVYLLPGGNQDPGESLPAALERELAEELGIRVTVEEMLLAGEVLNFNGKEDTLHCLFRATITEGEPHLNPEHTSARSIDWLTCEQLRQVPLYPNFAPYLEAAQSSDSFTYTGPLEQVFVR